jgi:hypothetical protein
LELGDSHAVASYSGVSAVYGDDVYVHEVWEPQARCRSSGYAAGRGTAFPAAAVTSFVILASDHQQGWSGEGSAGDYTGLYVGDRAAVIFEAPENHDYRSAMLIGSDRRGLCVRAFFMRAVDG